MTATPVAAAGPSLVIERILRDRDGVWRQISEQRGLPRLIQQMLVTSAISLAAYGAVLGASNGWLQALSSTVKLPLLFLATLAICLPTLYLFNLVFGARLGMTQAIALIMVSITVTAVLTLAFAPISLFFLVTARSYEFFKLLNVAILLLTSLVGLRFLTSGMRAINRAGVTHPALPAPVVQPPAVHPAAHPAAHPAVGQPVAVGFAAVEGQAPVANGNVLVAPAPAPVPELAVQQSMSVTPVPVRPAEPSTHMTLLYIWIVLFGFVGTQLAWTLRPFFGDPQQPFEIFRNIEGTFYSDIFRTLGRLFGV